MPEVMTAITSHLDATKPCVSGPDAPPRHSEA
jgi:hypothetical protein